MKKKSGYEKALVDANRIVSSELSLLHDVVRNAIRQSEKNSPTARRSNATIWGAIAKVQRKRAA